MNRGILSGKLSGIPAYVYFSGEIIFKTSQVQGSARKSGLPSTFLPVK